MVAEMTWDVGLGACQQLLYDVPDELIIYFGVTVDQDVSERDDSRVFIDLVGDGRQAAYSRALLLSTDWRK